MTRPILRWRRTVVSHLPPATISYLARAGTSASRCSCLSPMDASWVAAIAAVASVVIVAVAAIAALLQIRHIRNANEITVYLRLVERLDSPQSRAAFEALGQLLAGLENDPRL